MVGDAIGTELFATDPPVRIDGDAIDVLGWAHSGDSDPDTVDVFLVVTALATGGERVFPLADRHPRPDVAAAFGYPERSGFRGVLPVRALTPGTYRLGIVQRTPRTAYFDPTPVTVTLGRGSST
jgi:hypothetical protein